MTGKELILYILQNNLENTIVLEDCFFIGFMTEKEAAVKFEVGEGMEKRTDNFAEEVMSQIK